MVNLAVYEKGKHAGMVLTFDAACYARGYCVKALRNGSTVMSSHHIFPVTVDP